MAAGDELQKIRPGDRVYTLEDLTSCGFKESKAYDVAELPEAVVAYYGICGTDPCNRKDNEVRFYASREDAVEHGPAPAEERIGRDAKPTKETATWDEGIKDARECISSGGSNAQHASTCLEQKYFDYMIAANMVPVCQGRGSPMSLRACDALLGQMDAATQEMPA